MRDAPPLRTDGDRFVGFDGVALFKSKLSPFMILTPSLSYFLLFFDYQIPYHDNVKSPQNPKNINHENYNTKITESKKIYYTNINKQIKQVPIYTYTYTYR